MFFRQVCATVLKNKPIFQPKSELSEELIAEVVAAVKKRFVKGPIYSVHHSRVKDDSFIRSTQHIPNTNFLATAGPKDKDELIDFFNDTLFRDPPITHIVALGNRLTESDCRTKGIDFLNYYKKSYHVGPYYVSSQLINGGFSTRLTEKESKPNIYAETKITISTPDLRKNVTVIGIELKDGGFIDLKDDPNDKKKEVLWKIFRIAKTNPVLVHCKFGHGRTGHLILIMELLKHYSTAFSGDASNVIAENIMGILDNMRKQRPGLVHTRKQIIEAINNVIVLQRYGLEKGYIAQAEDNTPPEKTLRVRSS